MKRRVVESIQPAIRTTCPHCDQDQEVHDEFLYFRDAGSTQTRIKQTMAEVECVKCFKQFFVLEPGCYMKGGSVIADRIKDIVFNKKEI